MLVIVWTRHYSKNNRKNAINTMAIYTSLNVRFCKWTSAWKLYISRFFSVLNKNTSMCGGGNNGGLNLSSPKRFEQQRYNDPDS